MLWAMDVDDEEFGSPMPPSAEMDDVDGDQSTTPPFSDSLTVIAQQTPSSTSGGSQEKVDFTQGDVASGLISSSTPVPLRSSSYAPGGGGDRNDEARPFAASKLNGNHSDADHSKFTSREPYTHRISNAGLHGLNFGSDYDGTVSNNSAIDRHRLDSFHSKIGGTEIDKQLRGENRTAANFSMPRETFFGDAHGSALNKPFASSVPGSNLYHLGDSLSLSRRTSENATCQQCNFIDPSSSFASALAKVSMLNQLSTSGEDSGLGGGGVGVHEMAEIMHNYVRALHTSPAFQQFIQHRSATATAAGGSSPNPGMLLDELQPEPYMKNYPHHTHPHESTSSISSFSAATAGTSNKALAPRFLHESGLSHHLFSQWSESEQVLYVEFLLDQMQHSAQSRVNLYLRPKLQRDFISLLPKLGMQHIAECILEKLGELDLKCAEKVSPEWYRAVADGMQWKKLIERNVIRDTMWRGLGVRRGWIRHLFKRILHQFPAAQMSPILSNDYFRALYPDIVKDIKRLEENWRCGKHNLQRINCRSENSKGVYCLQYDEDKIISGLRDNTIKIWDKKTLQLQNTLKGHNGSVLCLQYDDKIIISGSSDATVRVWDVNTGEQLAHLLHHCEAVLHLRFGFGIMVTCSKDRSIAVWDMTSSRDINFRRNLVGHRAAVNVVDFDEKYIVSASGDRSIKVWNTQTCELVRNLNGHRRGIACLQYRDKLVVSGSSDYTIRIWDIELGHCLRTLEGHEELVRCIRFDNKRIVSGAYDGKIKVWDLEASLDVRRSAASLCIQTLVEHTGRVFRLQFDEFQIVSSSHDDTILIWDFFTARGNAAGSGAGAASVQQHQGGGSGAPPADGGGNSNNPGGAPPGGAGHAHYYHHNVNAGGAHPPPGSGSGGGYVGNEENSDVLVPKPMASSAESGSIDDAVYSQRRQRLPSNVTMSSVNQMMLPIQQNLQQQQRHQQSAAGVGGGAENNNSSSTSSSSSSTPLSAAMPHFALHADNVIISSHNSSDLSVAAGEGNYAGSSELSNMPKTSVSLGAACSSRFAATPGAEGSASAGSMDNIQPKLSKLELATTTASAKSSGQHRQRKPTRPATSSISAATGVSTGLAGSSRLLSQSSSHVSSPALFEIGDGISTGSIHSAHLVSHANDLAQPLARGQAGNSSEFGVAGGQFGVSTAFATNEAAVAGGDRHGLYVRHKAKRSVAAPVKYYREEGAAPMTVRHAAENAKVLQQLPATLHTTGKSLIPPTTTISSIAVSNSNDRPASEADSSSAISEVTSEADNMLPSRLISSDAM